MKKNVLLILITMLTINIFGQIGKGDVFISVNGNYSKNYSGSGVTTNEFNTSGKYLELGSTVEYFLTDRLSAGFGIDYQWSKETKRNELFLKFPDINYAHYQLMYSKSNVFLPNIFLKHYIPINSKLYFNTNLQLSYGNINSEYLTSVLDINRYNVDGAGYNMEDYPTFMNGSSKQTEIDFLAAELGPELTYFITPKFIGCLSMGGVEYGMYDLDIDNSVWTVNFNPVYWKIGFRIKI